MTELTNALFEFLTRNYIPGIYTDPEYETVKRYAEEKRQLLHSQLNTTQQQLLQDLLEYNKLTHFFEQEYIFQATLALSRELSNLVR